MGGDVTWRDPLRPDGTRMFLIPEAAFHLNCTVEIVRRLIRDGKLNAVRLSARCTRIPERELLRFVDQVDQMDRRRHVSFGLAADYLGISQKTLERKFIAGGVLPWYDFAGAKRIRVRDLIEFARNSRMVGPRSTVKARNRS
jgi:excisionase family DNA binding protein